MYIDSFQKMKLQLIDNEFMNEKRRVCFAVTAHHESIILMFLPEILQIFNIKVVKVITKNDNTYIFKIKNIIRCSKYTAKKGSESKILSLV